MKFFVKHDSDRQTKGRIVEIIKRPMLLTLIAYAIDICVSIAYYPAPMPIKFANFLTITFVVAPVTYKLTKDGASSWNKATGMTFPTGGTAVPFFLFEKTLLA